MKPLHLAIFLILSCISPLFSQDAPNLSSGFEGAWHTSYGPMQLTISGNQVTGTYTYQGIQGTINGVVEAGKLTFTYQEPTVSGQGEFTLTPDGQSFAGRWREQGQEQWAQWTGIRASAESPPGFAGLWTTTFGPMRLVQSGKQVSGSYSMAGVHCTLEGEIRDEKLQFSYEEPNAAGTGWFELAPGGLSFEGQWKSDGSNDADTWTGMRTPSRPGIIWLVVLEARWEASLTEREYAFGDMLETYFDRVPQVQVRHRFFTIESGFERWCREIAYIPEPVVISIACHGTPAGLTVGGEVIAPETIAKALAPSAGNTRLLHFSSCAIMAGDASQRMHKALPEEARFPISGYAANVGWAESAVLEFAYFDLILSRGNSPEVAAEKLLKLMPFAGDKPVPGTDVSPAKFRIVRDR